VGHRARGIARRVLVLELMREEDVPEERGRGDQPEPLQHECSLAPAPRRLPSERGGKEREPGEERGEERDPGERLAQVHDPVLPFSASAWYLEGHFTSS